MQKKKKINIELEKPIMIDSPKKDFKDSFVLEKFSEEENDPANGALTDKNVQIFDEKDFLKKLEENKKLENSSLEIGMFEYLKFLIKSKIGIKKTPKEALIDKADKIFMHELDMINILEKLHEIENLKILLLDADQRVVFNYLTKPCIKLNDEGKTENFYQRFANQTTLNKKNFIKSYEKCLNKGKNDEISKKLVGLCDSARLRQELKK